MGSGGGGSSGAVSLPQYQQELHAYAMATYSGGTPTDHFGAKYRLAVQIVNQMDNSPYNSLSAYDPDVRTAAMTGAALYFKNAADALAYGTDFPAFFVAAAAELTGVSHLSDMVSDIGELDTLVDGLTPTTGWEAMLASVVGKVVSTLLPQLHLTNASGELASLDSLLDSIVHTTDVKTMISNAATQIDTSIAPNKYFTAQAAAASAILGDDVDDTLSRYYAGMRDLNSIMISAYPIGAALLMNRKTDQLAKLTADLQSAAYMKRTDIIAQAVSDMVKLYLGEVAGRGEQARIGTSLYLTHDKNLIDAITAGTIEEVKLQLGKISGKVDSAKLSVLAYGQSDDTYGKQLISVADAMSRYHLQQLDFKRFAAQMTAEANRVALVAEKEETDINREIDVADALWNLELYKYLGNMLAAVQGAVVPHGAPGKSTASSAIGGALMGASAGAMLASAAPALAAAGPAGWLIGAGAALGVAAGLL